MEGSAARKHLANLTHPDEAIRHKATLALGDGERHRDWVPDLIAAVTEGSPDERFWAASPLARAADPGLAVPALIAMLYEPDRPANRQVATFTLVYALDDADQRVQEEAIQSLSLLGERASDALPALRGLASSDGQTAAIRSDASEAVERILGGAPAYRSDEPYRTLEDAVSKGRFSGPGVPDEARRRLEEEDFHGVFELLAASAAGDQHSIFWLEMFNAARELELPDARRYYERYLEASGLGGFWHELQRVVHSTCTVQKGMRRMIRYCARAEPSPRWKKFDSLPIDEDLPRLEAWLRAAFTDEGPPDDIPGLWFGLIDVDRDGESSFDMRVEGGHPDEHGPDDLVIGGSWEPQDAFANSTVLHQIHQMAHAEDDPALDDAEYRLALAYGGLVVRWLTRALSPELLLGGASERVLAVGFHDGDSIGIGTLRPDGLHFPGR